MKTTEIMTTDNPAKKIFFFAVPLIFGNIFQQLYTFFDTIIVGNIIGLDALAAVGTTEWLSFLMFGMIGGMTQGFSVYIAQKFGASDYKKMRQACVIPSIFLSVVRLYL